MRLLEKLWRATDESCLERTPRAIMRVAMNLELSHLGIAETERHDSGCRTGEAGFEWRLLAHKIRSEIPKRSLSVSGIIPGYEPGT